MQGAGKAKAGRIRFTNDEVPTSEELRRASMARKVEPGDVPDMSGKVLTVRAPVAPDELGVTLMHVKSIIGSGNIEDAAAP